MAAPFGPVSLIPPPLAGLAPPFKGPSAAVVRVGGPGLRDLGLTEDFSAPLAGAKWGNPGATAVVTGGQLHIPVAAGYDYVTTVASYDLTSSSVSVEFAQTPDATATSTEMILAFQSTALGGGWAIRLEWYNNTLLMRNRVAGGNDDASIAYDATAHRFVRISESVGNVSFDTSPDGITWTSQRTVATPWDITVGLVQLQAGTFGGDVSRDAVFDNVNLAPPALTSVTSTRATNWTTLATVTSTRATSWTTLAAASAASPVGTPQVGTATADTNAAHTTTTIPYPASVPAGHYAVLLGSMSVTGTASVPGFSHVTGSPLAGTSSFGQLVALTKDTFTDGTEGGTSVTVTHAAGGFAGQILTFPSVDTTTPLDVTPTTVNTNTASGSSILPSLTITTSGAALITLATLNGTTQTATPPSGFTETMDDHGLGTGVNRPTEVAYQTGVAAGATGTETVTWTASAKNGAILIALRPASTGGNTRATSWTTLTSVASTRATTWATAAPVTSTRATSWTTRAAVAATRATAWNTLASVLATRATSWNVAGGTVGFGRWSAIPSRSIPGVVRPGASGFTTSLTSVTSTRATTWNTAASVSATRATTWTALAAVTASTRATTWATRAAVTATRATTWATAAAVASTRATTWNTLASIAVTRATSWTVLASVTATRATTWATRAAVLSTRATTWNTAAAVLATRATSWATLASALATRATTWTTLASVTATRATTWNVASALTQVTSTRATTWATRASVLATRATSWNISAQVTATRAMTWTVTTSTTGTRQTTWSTRGGVNSTRTTTWSALASTTATRSTSWDTKAQAASAKATSWTTLASVTGTRATLWSVAPTAATIPQVLSTAAVYPRTSVAAVYPRASTAAVLTRTSKAAAQPRASTAAVLTRTSKET